jgi:hypothetical protein
VKEDMENMAVRNANVRIVDWSSAVKEAVSIVQNVMQ